VVELAGKTTHGRISSSWTEAGCTDQTAISASHRRRRQQGIDKYQPMRTSSSWLHWFNDNRAAKEKNATKSI
jgi:hypothetical protein